MPQNVTETRKSGVGGGASSTKLGAHVDCFASTILGEAKLQSNVYMIFDSLFAEIKKDVNLTPDPEDYRIGDAAHNAHVYHVGGSISLAVV
jgi:hypothetical protein